jgi:hypothetical protein
MLKKKFVTIKVGARGKQSDRTFSSTLFQLLQKSEFNVPPNKELPGMNIKLLHVLIGSEACPLKLFLMRPFPNRDLSPVKENFQQAFGILRASWWIFGKDMEVSPQKAVSIIVCMHTSHTRKMWGQ